MSLLFSQTCNPVIVWKCWLCGNLGRQLCPDPRWEWRPEFSKCYYVLDHDNAETWVVQNRKCSELASGATLTSIESIEEDNYIETLVNDISGAAPEEVNPFIGGYRDNNNKWNWADGSSFDFQNFEGTEPDGSGNCITIGSDNNWHDNDCNDKEPAICSIQVHTTTPPPPPSGCKSIYLVHVPMIFNRKLLEDTLVSGFDTFFFQLVPSAGPTVGQQMPQVLTNATSY